VTFGLRQYTLKLLPLKFPPPVIKEATGSGANVILAPLNAQAGATVRVTSTDILTGDRVQVSVTGRNAPVIPAQTATTGGTLQFLLPKEFIAANIGNASRTFTVNFKVMRGDIAASSELVTVTITPIPANALQNVRILEADNVKNELALTTVTKGATIRLDNWPLIGARQFLWLEILGTAPDGKSHNLVVLTPANAHVGWLPALYLDRLVPYTYWQGLGDRTTVQLLLHVAMNLGSVKGEAIAFPIKTYSFNAQPLLFENFDGQPQTLITAGQSISIPSMIITFASGANTMGIHTYRFPIAGMLAGPAITTNHNSEAPSKQTIRLSLRAGYSRVRFAYTYQIQPVEIFFLDATSILGKQDLPLNSRNRHTWIDFSAPAGKKVTTIDIVSRDYSYLDFFEFEP
jgi:hypothetical protein